MNLNKKSSRITPSHFQTPNRTQERFPKEKLVERKKLISNTLIFISRLLHQLEAYEYGELKSHKKLGKLDDKLGLENTQRNILENLSYLGMCLDHISIKTILQEPVSTNYLQLSGLMGQNSSGRLPVM